MMSLSEFVMQTSEAIGKAGGNKDEVYKSSISNAMIVCHSIAAEYAKARGNKNPPIPIAVVNKSNTDESLTQFKFSHDLNVPALSRAVEKVNNPNVNIEEYGSSISLDIYDNQKS